MVRLRIKVKILLLMLSLAIILSCLLYVLSWFAYDKLIDNIYNESTEYVHKLKNINADLAQNKLETFSKKYLTAVVNSIAEYITDGRKTYIPSDETIKEKVLNDPNIKEIVYYSKSINSKRVADFAIILNKKILLCSLSDKNNNPINSFNVWLEKYKPLRLYFLKNNHEDNFKIFSNVNKQYVVVKRIPKTECFIIGSIKPSKIIRNPLIPMQINIMLGIIGGNLKSLLAKFHVFLSVSQIIITLIIFALFIPLSFFYAAKITKPIVKLRNNVKKLGKGNFNIKIEDKYTSVEICDLVESFNSLGSELKRYMTNLEKEIIDREKLESEIKIAAEIQTSSLPIITEEFIRPEFSLASKLNPAAIAAGDFFDFFYISDKILALVIADVSGKGISAAFFMSLTKATLSSICRHETSPSVAINKTNHILSENNQKSMFVTTFLLFYNIETGEISYTNAGHHNAIVYNSNKKKIKFFGDSKNPPIGIIPHFSFGENKYKLDINDTILLYTDGATEAISPDTVEFGENNLLDLISEHKNLDINKLADKIVSSIRIYEEGNNFDDITLLIFRRNI